MKKHVKKIVICLLLTICCLCGALIGTTNNIVYAISNATKYTNVLYDLQTDENFDASDYVVDNTDYSLQVIQIAESNQKELFVYVYQPCSPNEDLKATSINISKGIDENLSYRNYTLTLLNSNGVFHKYRVEEFHVETTETRYYDISSIFRKWNSNYDGSLPGHNENTINEKALSISKLFIVNSSNETITYDCIATETVLITDMYVGFVRYDDSHRPLIGTGYSIMEPGFDGHFVAFNTNYSIDSLLEADVFYLSQHYSYEKESMYGIELSKTETFGSVSSHIAELTYESVGGGIGNGWRHYEWSRIQTVNDFVNTSDIDYSYKMGIFNVTDHEKITDEGLEDLQNMQWVLRFVETDFADYTTIPEYTNLRSDVKYWDIIGNVSILRLKFETNGVVYNLGVVCNKQTGDGIPDNERIFSVSLDENFSNLLRRILTIFLIALLIIVLSPFLPAIFNFIIWLFKGIWQVITAPFKAIKKQKKKTKKGGGKK